MTGPAPAEMWSVSGWFVLLGVIALSGLILAVSIWWDNRRNPVFRVESLPLPRATPKPQPTPKLPLADVVTAPDVSQGRHRLEPVV